MAWTSEQKDISRKSFQQWKAKNKANLNDGPGHHYYFRGRKQLEERHKSRSAYTYKRS